jgi:hypothetical protein
MYVLDTKRICDLVYVLENSTYKILLTKIFLASFCIAKMRHMQQ